MSILRDLSLILLVVEAALVALAILAALAVVNYFLLRSRWWRVIPGWFAVARGYLALGLRIVERVCRFIAMPILVIGSATAGLSRAARALPGERQSEQTRSAT